MKQSMRATVHDDSTQTFSRHVSIRHRLYSRLHSRSREYPCRCKWDVPIPHSTRGAEMTTCTHMKSDGITERLTTCRGLFTVREHRLNHCIITRHLCFPRKNKWLISQFNTLCSDQKTLLPAQRTSFNTANTYVLALTFSFQLVHEISSHLHVSCQRVYRS
jgi:hypothetical protein